MFTDLVQSTKLVEAIGDEAWRYLLAWHDTKLRSLFSAYQGQEVDHAGDGFFVAFSTPRAAVACAAAVPGDRLARPLFSRRSADPLAEKVSATGASPAESSSRI